MGQMGQEAERRAVTPEVSAVSGVFRGLTRNGVSIFRGIRYAEPPVGSLRFAPPVAAAKAETVQDAFDFGPVSIQDIDPLPLVIPGAENNYYTRNAVAAEDCLNLNVWSPDLNGRAPVLVWIHGGAFLCGSGSGDWLDGTRQARDNGLVVVTLNYRLGYLGGLYLGDYDRKRGNLALQDQLLALRWVKDNIAAFGGDPERVTVGGHSAGAMSTAALIVAPESRDLFKRGFIQSGHLDTIFSVGQARETTAYLLERLGVDRNGDVIGQLEDVSTFRLLSLQRELGLSRRAFPLVGDDITLPADPMAALAERTDVDILIGTTSEEDRLFAVTGWAPPAQGLSATLGRFLRDETAKAEGERIYAPVLAARGGDAVALTHLIATEHSWAEPARRLAATHAAAGGRSYLYEFEWASSALDGRFGAAHLVDLPFFFDNLDAPGVDELVGEAGQQEAARRLARGMAGALAAFAATGSPDGPLGDWPAFTPQRRATQVLSEHPHVEIDRLGERLDFWTGQLGQSARALSTLEA